jgi:hypothetical protein
MNHRTQGVSFWAGRELDHGHLGIAASARPVGCPVTIDAIDCQTAIACSIVEQPADYLSALKANHDQICGNISFLIADLSTSQNQAYAHDHARIRRPRLRPATPIRPQPAQTRRDCPSL